VLKEVVLLLISFTIRGYTFTMIDTVGLMLLFILLGELLEIDELGRYLLLGGG
jgi:hypothetical protein